MKKKKNIPLRDRDTPVSIPHTLLLIFVCAGGLMSQLLRLLRLLLVLVVWVWCGGGVVVWW